MDKIAKLQLLDQKVKICQKCPELANTRLNTVFGEGNPKSPLVFIAEAPGQHEDKTGRPFVGKAGELLNNILKAFGFERENVYILNCLKCRPPNNRTPTEEECTNCRPFLDLQLKIIDPKIIVCLGATAAQNLLGATHSVSSLRGIWHGIEINSHPVKVRVTWHPAYLLRQPSEKEGAAKDMQEVVNFLNLQKPTQAV